MLKSVLLLTGTLTISSAKDCSIVEELCGHNAVGDLPAAVACLTKHDATLSKVGCSFPEEAMSILKMAADPTRHQELAQGLAKSDFAAIVKTDNLGEALKDFAVVVDDTKLPTVFGKTKRSTFDGK